MVSAGAYFAKLYSTSKVTNNARAAFAEVGAMMTGAPKLRDEPGVLSALKQANANPAQAQAIGHFMMGLQAQQQVSLARQYNNTIHLTNEQKYALDSMGVDYSDTEHSHATSALSLIQKQQRQKLMGTQGDAVNQDVAHAADAGALDTSQAAPDQGAVDLAHQINTQGFFAPKTEHQSMLGSITSGIGDALGAVKTAVRGGEGETPAEIAGSPTITSAIAGAGHELHNVAAVPAVPDATREVFKALSEGLNFVQTGLSSIPSDPRNIMTRAQDMKAQGYDPTSWASTLAFFGSGKAHGNLSDLNEKYGEDRVNEALAYNNNPTKVKQGFAQDPSNFTTGQDGRVKLSAKGEANYKWLSSPAFESMTRQVSAQRATVGNHVANFMRIDPVHEAGLYEGVSAVANVAAAFALDPTLIGLQTVTRARAAALSLNNLDGTHAARILLADPAEFGPLERVFVGRVQRGWQNGIQYGHDMRQAIADGDVGRQAALTAGFRQGNPALADIAPEFIGNHAYTGVSGELIDGGRRQAQKMFGVTGGIRDMEDAANFLVNAHGLSRLMVGKAAQQAGMMPGAVSAVGYRRLRGATAQMFTQRSWNVTQKWEQEALNRLEADPEKMQRWVDEGLVRRWSPSEIDAVDPDGTVLAGSDTGQEAGTLASQRRAELTPAGVGQVGFNTRATGDVLGEANKADGLLSPRAIAARWENTRRRFSQMLPESSVIRYDDVRGGQLVRQTVAMYGTKAQASAAEAAWNAGTQAERKALMDGVMDQMIHASGLMRTDSGQMLAAKLKGADERYAHVGGDITLGGKPIALTEEQLAEGRPIPSFNLLREAADTLGYYEHTLGRVVDSNFIDNFMATWKTGALLKPSSFTRNWLEPQLRMMLDGSYGPTLQKQALLKTPNKEGWARGLHADTLAEYEGLEASLPDLKGAELAEAKRRMATLEEHDIIQHKLALDTGDTERARQIANASMMSGEYLGRGYLGSKSARALAWYGRVHRAATGRFVTPEDLEAFESLSRHDIELMVEKFHQGTVGHDLGLGQAAADATLDSAKGWGTASAYSGAKRAVVKGQEVREMLKAEGPTEWAAQVADDTVGADRWSRAMGRQFGNSPATREAILQHLKDPEQYTLRDHVVPAMAYEERGTGFGKLHFPDPENPNEAALAVTDEEQMAGMLDWAGRRVEQVRYLLTNRAKVDRKTGLVTEGEINQRVLDHMLETGEVPSGEWLANNIHNADRPAAALAPITAPLVNGGASNLWNGFQDVSGAMYQYMVERMLWRNVTVPVMVHHYTEAYKMLAADREALMAEGFSREAAVNMSRETAMRIAARKTEQITDDPHMKTQFDVSSKNIFPFARATQAMIRRWVSGIYQNPVAARKMMLAYEGAHHSGLVYTNQYGEPSFTYPTSGVARSLWMALNQIPGWEGSYSFPLSSDMTGGVLMSVPGADNPFRMGMGPAASIPFRLVYEHLLPTSYKGDLRSLDEFINGPVGVGETAVQLVPTAIRHFYQAMDTNERNSALASSMNGALMNLAAAGLVPDPSAPDSAKQQFLNRLQTQTRSQLWLRFALGLVAPAAPSRPTEHVAGAEASYAWNPQAILGLSDEYKSILNEADGVVARANAIFTYMHPDSVVYKVDSDGNPVAVKGAKLPSAASTAITQSTSGSYLPATKNALKWIDSHGEFIKKYGGMASLFMPASASDGEFESAAYNAELQEGLRQRKTPKEFLDGVYAKSAQDAYYSIKDQYDAAISNAHADDNSTLAAQLEGAKKAWAQKYLALNPSLNAKMAGYATRKTTAENNLLQLRGMLKQGEVPNNMGREMLGLVTAYDQYTKYTGGLYGNSNQVKQEKEFALSQFNDYAKQHVSENGLSVYNAIFRPLNEKFVELGE